MQIQFLIVSNMESKIDKPVPIMERQAEAISVISYTREVTLECGYGCQDFVKMLTNRFHGFSHDQRFAPCLLFAIHYYHFSLIKSGKQCQMTGTIDQHI